MAKAMIKVSGSKRKQAGRGSRMIRYRFVCAVILLACLGVPLSALAQPRKSPGPQPSGPESPNEPKRRDAGAETERPWAEGVTIERQKQAETLYLQGDELLQEFLPDEALVKYQDALAAWDHPQIRFRIASVLYSRGERIAAYQQIEAALRYGQPALGDTFYKQAMRYKSQLANELGWLTIHCQERGAEVLLNGERVLTGPGSVTKVLFPGKYTLVAKKPGYMTKTAALELSPAERSSHTVSLLTFAEATAKKRRWPAWKPWALASAGIVLGAIGTGLVFRAQADYEQFDRDFSAAYPGGQDDAMIQDPALGDLRNQARWEQRIGTGTLILSGALLASGITLVLLNKEQPLHPEYFGAPGLAVAPVVSPTQVGAVGSWRF